MARSILPTPVLRGSDARRFVKNLNRPRPLSVPVIDLKKLDRAMERWAQNNGTKRS